MDRLERTARRVGSVGIFAGGLMLIAAALYVTAEVLCRKLFNFGLEGANELSEYALAVGSAWALSETLLERGHIRIDLVLRTFPARVRATAHVLAMLSMTGYAAILVWYGGGVLGYAIQHGIRSNTPMGAPMWIPQGLWFLGLLTFLLFAILLLVKSALALVRGDFDEVTRLAGTPEIEEEAIAAAKEAGVAPGATASGGA